MAIETPYYQELARQMKFYENQFTETINKLAEIEEKMKAEKELMKARIDPETRPHSAVMFVEDVKSTFCQGQPISSETADSNCWVRRLKYNVIKNRTSKKDRVGARMFYGIYQTYCEENDLNPVTEKAFALALNDIIKVGVNKFRSKSGFTIELQSL